MMSRRDENLLDFEELSWFDACEQVISYNIAGFKAARCEVKTILLGFQWPLLRSFFPCSHKWGKNTSVLGGT